MNIKKRNSKAWCIPQNFFKNVDLGVMSFLEASKTVINLAPNEKDVILFQLKKVLWLLKKMLQSLLERLYKTLYNY